MHLLAPPVSNTTCREEEHDPLPVHWISLLELLEHADLNLAGVAIFRYRTYDLDGHAFGEVGVKGLDHLAESALAEELDGPICATYEYSRITQSAVKQTHSDQRSCRRCG
jgi:hypothetical protein